MKCTTKAKPLKVRKKIVPYGNNKFKLGSGEQFLSDIIASELTKIAGTQVEIYQRNEAKSTRNALYDEVISDAWNVYRVSGWVQYPDGDPNPDQAGFVEIWPSTVWIARLELENAGARYPKIGDVVLFWDTPFFKDIAKTSDPKRGFYFGVIKVDDDGHINDTDVFVGFKLTLKRATTFAPERRLFNT